MKAMQITKVTELKSNSEPLTYSEIPIPVPGQNEVLIRINTCGVCHTELDEIEGRTPPPEFPMIPGHQVVGIVEKTGNQVLNVGVGDRVGVAWIFSSCGKCEYCKRGEDNLCEEFKATGRDANGGYAEFMTVPGSSVFPIPDTFSDAEAAPLLCAGAIGYRSLRLTGLTNGKSMGLTGFGASAHLVLKMARYKFPDSPVYVFARSEKERDFAMELGAVWAGNTTDTPPELIDSVIDTTPVWRPVVAALQRLKPGGRLVINAIRKEDVDKEALQSLDYGRHLWMEKEIKSVANVARIDVEEFLELAGAIPIKPDFQEYDLKDANTALVDLKQQRIRGAKVLRIG